MALSNFLTNQMLTAYFGSAASHWIALHASDPTVAGLADTELNAVTIPSYARQPVTWSAPANRAVTNANLIYWAALPVVSCGYIAVWDAKAGGNLLAVMECVQPLEVYQAGGSIYLPEQSIGITFGGSPGGRAALAS